VKDSATLANAALPNVNALATDICSRTTKEECGKMAKERGKYYHTIKKRWVL
jgi:hypothetical protein